MENVSLVPVSEIESIGAATARRLKTISVFSVGDLLLCAPEKIHKVVSTTNSMQEVVAWRHTADLLQIEGLTPQWAEALVAAHVTRAERVVTTSPDQLMKILRLAKRRAIIPDVPTYSEIAEIKTDAAILHYTGTCIGIVLNEESKGVSSAVIQIGQVSTKTDRRGRFRLNRLALDRSPPMTVRHKNYVTNVVEDIQIGSAQSAAKPMRVLLQSKSDMVSGDEALILSESKGDVLPAISGHRIRSKRLPVSDMPDGDILQYRRDFANNRDVELVSRFKKFTQGEFIVNTYKVPKSKLPQNVELRSHVRRKNGEFTSIRVSPKSHQYELAFRRLLKDKPDYKKPKTAKQYTKFYKDLKRHLAGGI